jgi:virginiamycin B lyase
MAVGSDGNLWFGGYEGRGTTFATVVWRMTPAGAFTTIALPAGSTIGKMVSGPDGALWFDGERDLDAETPVAVIGRMTTDGQVTTFPTPSQTKGGGALDICVGPNNAIWYTWTASLSDAATPITGRIGRVSLTGQIEEFAVPYAPGWSIASGSDGALWYSEIAANTSGDFPTAIRRGYIGRITTAGVASDLPIDPNTRIGGLAAGSDGAIWYTADGDRTGAFGRITPSGGVKAFSTNGNAPIDLIATAPGALWLFDSRNNLWHYRLSA